MAKISLDDENADNVNLNNDLLIDTMKCMAKSLGMSQKIIINQETHDKQVNNKTWYDKDCIIAAKLMRKAHRKVIDEKSHKAFVESRNNYSNLKKFKKVNI